MKKYLNLLVAVICGILLICGCDSNNDSVASDSDLEQSAGPYVCVKEIRHNYVDDQVLSYGIRFAYDESGKEIMTYGYTIENGLEIPKDFTDEYQYDEKGNMIHFALKKISTGNDSSRETDIEYEYDEFGRVIYSKSYEHDADGIQTYSEYSYNESGNLCQEIRYDQQNNKQYAYSRAEDFEYDEYGNVIKQTVHFTVDPDSAYDGESYYDYSVIEYQYLPLSVYLESNSTDLSGLWHDMYRVHTQYEISENTISYSDSSLDHREYTYEIIDDTHIRLAENGAESQVFSCFYYTENDENYLVIGGIDSLYGVCTLKQSIGNTSETLIPDDKYGEAAVIASETIERFWRYYTYYECCDIEILGYGSEFMESPYFELLSNEQQSQFRDLDRSGAYAAKSLCCCSAEESDAQIHRYLSESVIQSVTGDVMKFEVDDQLIFGLGYAMGIDYFDTNPRKITIRSVDDSQIIAVTNHYNSGSALMGEAIFYLTKDSDHYVLTNVDIPN